jgi:precorrin-6A/cobalt-precorrin-6A reductase
MASPAHRLLILGGTTEARTLAKALAGRAGLSVMSSLAGRLRSPMLPVGDVRIGGFDGAAGLTAYLRAQDVDVVIDATHPFASTISRHADEATREVDCKLIVLRRPGWIEAEGDDWTRAPDIAAAASWAAGRPIGCIFLTTGRRDLARFAEDNSHDYLVRSVEAPTPPLPPHATILLARGPFELAGELAVMEHYAVSLLVTKDTGGAMTEPKLAAARELGIPVLLVDRPPQPPAERVARTVDEALLVLETLGLAGMSRATR